MSRSPSRKHPAKVRYGNRGETSLRTRSRAGDPMQVYDTLPAPLRRWLADAVMPWSPRSCRRIWLRALASGEPIEAALARLDRAEQSRLAADTSRQIPIAVAPPNTFNCPGKESR